MRFLHNSIAATLVVLMHGSAESLDDLDASLESASTSDMSREVSATSDIKLDDLNVTSLDSSATEADIETDLDDDDISLSASPKPMVEITLGNGDLVSALSDLLSKASCNGCGLDQDKFADKLVAAIREDRKELTTVAPMIELAVTPTISPPTDLPAPTPCTACPACPLPNLPIELPNKCPHCRCKSRETGSNESDEKTVSDKKSAIEYAKLPAKLISDEYSPTKLTSDEYSKRPEKLVSYEYSQPPAKFNDIMKTVKSSNASKSKTACTAKSGSTSVLFMMNKQFGFRARINGQRVALRLNTGSSRSQWNMPPRVVRIAGAKISFARWTRATGSLGASLSSHLVKGVPVALVPGDNRIALLANPPATLGALVCRSKRLHRVSAGKGSVAVGGVAEPSSFRFVTGSSRIELGPLAWAQFNNKPTITITIGNLRVALHRRDYMAGGKVLVVPGKRSTLVLGAPFMRKVVSVWTNGKIFMCVPKKLAPASSGKVTLPAPRNVLAQQLWK